MRTVKRTANFPWTSRPELPRVARSVVSLLGRSGHTVAFSGPLGAGKSTLVRAIGKRLGVRRLPSPTYVLVRRYRLRSRRFRWLIHADLYRLPRGADLDPTGLLEDLANPTALVLVEWPERTPNLHTDATVRCALVPGSVDRRSFMLARRGHHRGGGRARH